MKRFFIGAMMLVLGIISTPSRACTNFIITRGASTDGSILVTYAADSHQLYGELYQHRAAKYKAGAMMPVYEWDTGKYLGDIPQVSQTYSTLSNMN